MVVEETRFTTAAGVREAPEVGDFGSDALKYIKKIDKQFQKDQGQSNLMKSHEYICEKYIGTCLVLSSESVATMVSTNSKFSGVIWNNIFLTTIS